MRKNTTFFLLAAALVLCMLAGCTGNKTAGDTPENAVGISASGDASSTDACPPDEQIVQFKDDGGGINKEDKQKFFQAEMQGDIDKVQQMLRTNKKLLGIRNELGGTPLHVATKTGKLAIVKLLIAEGADVKAVNNDKRNLLHVAATHNQVEIAEFLADNGVDLDGRSNILSVPLHDAVVTGNVELVKVLVEKGANMNATSKMGLTPLTAAMLRDRTDIVEYLLSKGARYDRLAADPTTKARVKNETFCCENL